MVQGSGPSDRDETIGPNAPFRDIAHGLAKKGIASIRYDKRTFVYKEKMAESIDSVTVEEETIQDAISAVRLAQQQPDVDPDKVVVLGHSLGGMLAPRIVAEDNDDAIKAIIMMAACARPLEDVIIDQYQYLLGLDGWGSQDQEIMDKLKAEAGNVRKLRTNAMLNNLDLPLGLPVAYWADLARYDQVETAKNLKIPMLILQGGRDYQVTSRDYELWQQALDKKHKVTFKYYPDLNHLFIAGTGKSTPKEYDTAGTVSGKVIDDIAEFISKEVR